MTKKKETAEEREERLYWAQATRDHNRNRCGGMEEGCLLCDIERMAAKGSN